MARDLTHNRCATFDELAQYAYGVASTVGLMVSHIVGFDGPQAIPYAVKLGVAFQITNILRDIGEDWQAFMRFQIARNRMLHAEARPGIAMLHPSARFAITAAADLYEGILDDISAHEHDVFSRRAHLSAGRKLRRLPAIWWGVQQMRSAGPIPRRVRELA